MNGSKWKSDYQEFKDVKQITPPQHLNESVLSFVRGELSPSPWKVFSKVSFIHLISALVTLSFCPQFGFRIFGEGMGLMQHFMHLGSWGCMMACGSFFLGATLVLSLFVLKPAEILALRSHRIATLGALVLLSLGFFIMVDADHILFSIASAWALGSMLGGIAVLELGWILKFSRSQA